MSPKTVCSTIILALTVVTVCFSSDFSQSPTSLTYLTEEYPPYNFQEKGELKGVAVELLQEIWKEIGVPEQNIKLVPWARGYIVVLNKKNTVLFSTTRSKEREDLFKWVGPIKSNIIGLVAKKSKGIKIVSVNDIFKYKIGTVRGDISESLLEGFGYKVESKTKATQYLHSIKMLNSNRVDLIANSFDVIMHIFKDQGLNPNDYESVWTLSDASEYYAFHIDTPDELIADFQKALDKLEDTRMELLKKYEIK
jgi:polar amino acid transport system substrate-binding protein